MQNVGQQYGQGGASSHQGAPYGHTDSSSSNSGSITSSLRQFRKKDVEKQHVSDTNPPVSESHVARVAPHNHYPPRPSECFRYPSQFPDYSLPSPVKYSEISDPQQQDHVPPSVIQKAKGKEFMEMCNVQQNHMKQSYTDHINQQTYPAESNLHAHAQYLPKDPQVPSYKPESQYFPKEPPYQQLPQQIPKYNMSPQIRKYPTENDFLSKLRRIHPSMARSIMSDHHLQESQPSYQNMDQNRMYPPQNQRYMNYPTSLPNNPYPHSYMPPQHYSNYPSSCSYTRPSQMGARFPSMNPHERSISPRRGFTDNLPMATMNYGTLPQKISPNYSQYNTPEYSQHYQHRRAPLAPQEYYQQHCRPQYLPHQMAPQEMPENRVTVSDSIKQYIENWADEETASEMNQLESSRLCKENIRVRDDQSTETVYMINASELQYLENGIPLVTSENGIPLVASENGQYILKSGVSIDNSTGMVRLVDKTNQVERGENNADRVVNLHIMDPLKPDCMLAKPNDLNQRPNENLYIPDDKPKVVIHQNTVIQPGLQTVPKDFDDIPKLGDSLPMIADNKLISPLEKFEENIFKECKKETVDKNCSPINMEQLEKFEQFEENLCQKSVICPTKLSQVIDEEDGKTKNMPFIDMLTEGIPGENDDYETKEEKPEMKKEETNQWKHKNEDENAAEILSDIHTKNEQNIDEDCKSKEDTNISENEIKDGIIENEKNEEEVEENVELQSDVIGETPPTIEGHVEVFSEKEETTNIGREPLDAEKESATASVNAIIEENENIPKSSEHDTIQDDKLDASSQENSVPDNTEMDINMKTVSEENSTILPPKLSIEETPIKINNKRTSRSFSVDDIMNNIGANFDKSKHHKELVARRRSLQLTKEKEVEESCLFSSKEKESNIMEFGTENEKTKDTKGKTADILDNCGKTVEMLDIIEQQEHEDINTVNEEAIENTSEEPAADKEEIDADKANPLNVEKCADHTKNSGDNTSTKETKDLQGNIVKEPSDTCREKSDPVVHLEDTTKKESPIADYLNKLEESGVVEDLITKHEDADVVEELNVKHTFVETISHNEVQYRSAIRVEENSVLLQIAGELVEINVNTVNGKKVITVVPLSESTVVDFNDNYETLESPQNHDPTKSDVNESAHGNNVADLLPVEVIPETDVIESTSEIIIGMDISLEEEIQLDLEKPPLCTKAAKKAYENDLQIPAITTSEDFNDNNKVDSDAANDKVSSSKEQSHPKQKIEKKTTKNEDRGVRVLKDAERISKEVERIKKIKKVKLKEAEIEEEEEFVPFKDLVKARKLKKLKLQQSKCSDNISADSTNKIDQEDNEAATKLKKTNDQDEKKVGEEPAKKLKAAEIKHSVTKTKDYKPKLALENSTPSTELVKELVKELKEARKIEKPTIVEVVKSHTKEDGNAVNSSTRDTPAMNVERKEVVDNNTKEKIAKKVSFGGIDFKEPLAETKPYKLSDPRIRAKPSCGIMVPSVSEILKENEGLENGKRKLSLEEYNKRKRKLSANTNAPDQVKCKKNTEKDAVKVAEKPKVDDRKMQRPKSLDDIKLLGKPKELIHAKRKLSLEVTSSKPNYFDWEETQSPKTNPHCQEADKRLNEFSGLINNNKSKIVIDINDLDAKPTPSDNSQDEILQNYKEQVDSKLSSLNIQIPRPIKPINPLSNPEMNNLMQRFLRNEKVTYEEMEKIKQVISYKRLVQQMHKIKPQDLVGSPLSPSYEIRKTCVEKDTKLHLKKVPDKLKKRRFRNLYSESATDTDSDFSEPKKNGDYSVVQSNCFAAGVPKLIIKRKTEMPVPVVRLERLDLDLLANKKRKIY